MRKHPFYLYVLLIYLFVCLLVIDEDAADPAIPAGELKIAFLVVQKKFICRNEMQLPLIKPDVQKYFSFFLEHAHRVATKCILSCILIQRS